MVSVSFLVSMAIAAAGIISAFKIPKGLVDGVYIADLTTGKYQALGYFNASDVKALTSGPSKSARFLPRALPVSESGCPGQKMTALDYTGAYEGSYKFCKAGGKLGGKLVRWSIVGSAAWYGCSHGGENPCSGAEVAEAEHYMNNKCGYTRPGWIWMKDWLKTYGRDNVSGGDICTNIPGQRSSPSRHKWVCGGMSRWK